MGEKFNLAEALKNVPDMGTDREQIEYIEISQLKSDERNFYQLTDLEQLAANIELIGLQQPIRVRPDPTEAGMYVVVSGHRRRAALELLVKAGNDKFLSVPCIVETSAISDAMQELRLIYANSDTRRMTSAETSKQAERVEALLYQLKEEGVEFPGRMRDHVAEACKVSKSKLARLKVIRDNLAFEYRYLWDAGELSEAVAYALAKHPQKVQRDLHRLKTTGPKQWTECSVESSIRTYERITTRECKHSLCGKCDNSDAVLQKIWDNSYSYKPCEYTCCANCPQLGSCKTACSHMADRAKKIKADAKEEKRQSKLAQEAKDAVIIAEIQKFWIRYAIARQRSGKTVKAVFSAMGRNYHEVYEREFLEMEKGAAKITAHSPLPYTYSFDLDSAKALIGAADCLGCSVDFLLCRTDYLNTPAKTAMWMSGEQLPEEPCEVLADFAMDEAAIRKLCWFDGEGFRFSIGGATIDLPPIRWMAVPEVVNG